MKVSYYKSIHAYYPDFQYHIETVKADFDLLEEIIENGIKGITFLSKTIDRDKIDWFYTYNKVNNKYYLHFRKEEDAMMAALYCS